MTTVALVTMGTSGDVSPFVALALALRERGVRPVVITHPYHRSRLEAVGLPSRICGAAWDPASLVFDRRLMRPMFGPLGIWKHLYLPFVEESYREVLALLGDEPVSLVLNHIWCFGGFLAARRAGVSHGMVSLAPLTWVSSVDPSVYGPWTPPSWLHARLVSPMRGAFNMVMGRDLQAFCRKEGLPPLDDSYFAGLNQAAVNLGLWSSAWRGPASDDPPHARICGFPGLTPLDNTPALAPELEAFLQEGEAPVVLGLGSVLPQGAGDVYRAVARACDRLKLRAVLVGADPADIPASSSLFPTPYAPYAALFPRARLTLHHGGIGTLAEAMQAGHPSIVIPFANDQYDNARRAAMAGQAVLLPRAKVSVSRLVKLLRRCLDNRKLAQQAHDLGQRIRDEGDGAANAATWLLQRFG